MSVTTTETTARLVERARDPAASVQDQHHAFTRLVQETQRFVFGLALASLRDADDAKDVAQDAFVTAWHRLGQLRNPSAFEPWLKSIVARECSRRRRRPALARHAMTLPTSVESDARRMDYHSAIASALDQLSDGERKVTVLFYFLGYSQPQIARLLLLKPGTVGKRLHSARLRIRLGLPRSVRRDFVRLHPTKEFVERVRRGLLDEYIGEYRFERRPDLLVSITREGDSLISDAGGQRHVLLSLGDQSLVTVHFDGEGRFHRNRRGEVTHFVYYEFGRRMGVARRVAHAVPSEERRSGRHVVGTPEERVIRNGRGRRQRSRQAESL
jgi:RNA polymerase sigma factor (sigma-70 family)